MIQPNLPDSFIDVFVISFMMLFVHYVTTPDNYAESEEIEQAFLIEACGLNSGRAWLENQPSTTRFRWSRRILYYKMVSKKDSTIKLIRNIIDDEAIKLAKETFNVDILDEYNATTKCECLKLKYKELDSNFDFELVYLVDDYARSTKFPYTLSYIDLVTGISITKTVKVEDPNPFRTNQLITFKASIENNKKPKLILKK